MSIEELKNQIWITRVSRVNAEKRLICKVNFSQGINIYYSCMTIIFSILALINNDAQLSVLTVFMTVSLLLVILYLNSQRYKENAREYRKNYTELQRLELRLDHITDENCQEVRDIEQEYCDLLDSANNHSTYDYYCTVYGSNVDFKKGRWEGIRRLFWMNRIWRGIVKILLVLLPIILYLMCEVV